MNERYKLKLEQFCTQVMYNRIWLSLAPLRVYLRIQPMMFSPGDVRRALHIVNIEVPNHANIGLRSAWAIHELVEAALSLPIPIYVENVGEKTLASYFRRHKQFEKLQNTYDPTDLCPCFIAKRQTVSK